MPLFDITSGIKAQYRSGATPQTAYDIMKKVVVAFAKRGYSVSWTEQRPPERVVARLTDKDGTDLLAEMNVIDEGTVTRCDINIHGHVFLGGLLGRLVSASTIQSRAQDKIKEMLDENFAGQPSKRAPVAKAAAAAAPKAAAPTTLPPGHPGARGASPAPAPAAPAPAAPAPAPAASPVAAPAAPAAPAASAPAPPAPAPSTFTSTETWQALSERVLGGGPGASDAQVAIRQAASAAGALGEPTLIQFVQIGLVQVLAKGRGKKVDRAAAAQLLARLGAGAMAQVEMAKGASSSSSPLAPITASYALTAALGEAALRSFDDAPPGDDVLQDIFGERFERVHGEKLALLTSTEQAAGSKLLQVREAYDADLLTETEMLALRERVLVSI